MMFTICQFENEALDEMNDGKFKKKKRVRPNDIILI